MEYQLEQYGEIAKILLKKVYEFYNLNVGKNVSTEETVKIDISKIQRFLYSLTTTAIKS